ncbi:MAG: trimeric intracellular cation channel family protein [Chitinophagaceae bacterium]|nr:MAG: trimeric intracellular cation channel family protein [Chitinophagaceae bacterium]
MTFSEFLFIIEMLGTAAFTMSGVFAAIEKKLDVFGVLVIGFVTAIGGGTIRDMLIGVTPVTWMTDNATILVILLSAAMAVLFRKRLANFRKTLFFLDALGLGIFTIIGIQKGTTVNLSPGVCIALGTITGCFGGVVRDILLNRIPTLFLKGLYATPCIAGGIIYFILGGRTSEGFAQGVAIATVCLLRIIAYRNKWTLPSL